MQMPENAADPLRAAQRQLTYDVRQALQQVSPEVAESAVGHAVLAQALIQIAADILKRQDNGTFLEISLCSFDKGKVVSHSLAEHVEHHA